MHTFNQIELKLKFISFFLKKSHVIYRPLGEWAVAETRDRPGTKHKNSQAEPVLSEPDFFHLTVLALTEKMVIKFKQKIFSTKFQGKVFRLRPRLIGCHNVPIQFITFSYYDLKNISNSIEAAISRQIGEAKRRGFAYMQMMVSRFSLELHDPMLHLTFDPDVYLVNHH